MRFGRRILHLYNTYPLLANSLTGSFVYLSGELTVQYIATDSNIVNKTKKDSINKITQFDDIKKMISNEIVYTKENIMINYKIIVDKLSKLNYRRAIHLAMLGFIENGLIMLYWYKFLAKAVGVSTTTTVVLIKCFLDQIFYATQQDSAFLMFYAYTQIKSNNLFSITKEEIKGIWKELSRNFLTTWINDCSIWPLINFVGFAYLPYNIQPTFMSLCQFFWQIYLSAVASNTKICDEKTTEKLINTNHKIVHIEKQIEKSYFTTNFFNSFFEYDYFNPQKQKVELDKLNRNKSKQKQVDNKPSDNAIVQDNKSLSNQLDINNLVITINELIISEEEFDPQVKLEMLKDRELALLNAQLGMSALFICAMIRIIVFKI